MSVSDFDSPWKEALDDYFEAFLAFFFPRIHHAIDWSRSFETLDKELQQIMPDAETGRRYVDKLVKVWRQDGNEEWVLIHIEIQHDCDTDFPRRMFVYYYRLLDRYHRKVASLAVLGDDRAGWRPDRYNDELWECSVDFRFPVVKLLDWEPKWEALELDANPFAVIVLADLKARETKKDPQTRKEWKFRIVRGLYERGMEKNEVRRLLRVIDWMMELPEPLALVFDQDIHKYEVEKQMPYVTSFERHGIEKGKREGLLEGIKSGLTIKFGKSGLAIFPVIRKIENVKTLGAILKAITKAATIEEIRSLLD